MKKVVIDSQRQSKYWQLTIICNTQRPKQLHFLSFASIVSSHCGHLFARIHPAVLWRSTASSFPADPAQSNTTGWFSDPDDWRRPSCFCFLQHFFICCFGIVTIWWQHYNKQKSVWTQIWCLFYVYFLRSEWKLVILPKVKMTSSWGFTMFLVFQLKIMFPPVNPLCKKKIIIKILFWRLLSVDSFARLTKDYKPIP